MKAHTKLILIHLLEQAKEDLNEGKCQLSDDEGFSVIESLKEIMYPKPSMEAYNITQSCNKLHISQPTFRKYVRLGKIPECTRVQGFKELVWYKSDIDNLELK